MKIKITQSQYSRILKEDDIKKTPEEQLEDFEINEDIKIRSSFIKKSVVQKWLKYLQNKYPDLSFRFEYGNDILIAQARIKR